MRYVQIFTVMLFAILVGCEGSQKSTADQTREVQNQQTSKAAASVRPVADLVEARMQWFPRDTAVVVVFRSEYVWDAALEFMPRGSSSEDIDALKKRLGEIWFPGMEANPFDATSLSVGFGRSGATLIFDGEFPEPKNLKSTKVDGRTVYSVDEEYPDDRSLRNIGTTGISLAKIEDRPGLAVHLNSGAEQDGPAWPSSTGLATEKQDSFKEMLQMAPEAGVVGIILEERSEAGVDVREIPRAVMDTLDMRGVNFTAKFIISFGDDISLGFVGAPEELSTLEKEFDEKFAELQKLSERTATTSSGPSADNLAGAFFHYFPGGFARGVQKKRTDDSLLYTAPAPRSLGAALYYHDRFDNWVRTTSRATKRSARDSTENDEVQNVVKAAKKLEAGTVLRESMLKSEEVPIRFLPPNPVIAEELNIYIGSKLATDIEEGALLLTTDFKTTAD